jgi:hypothetical protein
LAKSICGINSAPKLHFYCFHHDLFYLVLKSLHPVVLETVVVGGADDVDGSAVVGGAAAVVSPVVVGGSTVDVIIVVVVGQILQSPQVLGQ